MEKELLYCSFCGADNTQRDRVVKGPDNKNICSNCVDRCKKVLENPTTEISCSFCWQPDSPGNGIIMQKNGHSICKQCVKDAKRTILEYEEEKKAGI